MQLIEISFRHRDVGGKLLETPNWNEFHFAAESRLILLVHGFNVSKPNAEMSYRQFRCHFRDHPSIGLKLGQVYWPGDEKFWPYSVAMFHTKIPVAVKTGELLEKYLRDRKFGSTSNTPSELVLIGHSLGCRIILETLRVMAASRRHPPLYKVRIFLMAAGVPVQMVEPKGRLRKAAEFAINAYTFYSPRDLALSAYPIGQRRAREEKEINFEAVGKEGNPHDGIWTETIEQQYSHNQYWTDPSAARKILRRLGKAAALPIEERVMPRPPEADRRLIASWPVAAFRKLHSRRDGECEET